MIPFTVKIEGMTQEGQCAWVLAVNGEQLLTAKTNGDLQWYPLANCKFVRLVNPETPKMVIPIQSTPGNGLVVPPPPGIAHHAT